jgi:hypothetical protein
MHENKNLNFFSDETECILVIFTLFFVFMKQRMALKYKSFIFKQFVLSDFISKCPVK